MAHTPQTYADAQSAVSSVFQLSHALLCRFSSDGPVETEAEHAARITGPDFAGCARTLRDAADALEALWDEVHDGPSPEPGPTFLDVAAAADRLNAAAGYGPGVVHVEGRPVRRGGRS